MMESVKFTVVVWACANLLPLPACGDSKIPGYRRC